MDSRTIIKCFLPGILLAAGALAEAAPWRKIQQAESCRIDKERVAVVRQDKFNGKQGVVLKESSGDNSSLSVKNPKSDLTFTFNIPKSGFYELYTRAVVDEHGAKLMKKARNKFGSLFAKIQVPGNRATRRVVYVPWFNPKLYVSNLGIFYMSEGKQSIRIDLPRGVVLDQLRVSEYVMPAVPKAAQNYKLPFEVPRRHPRLLMDPQVLARIKAQIKHPENAPYWEKLRNIAEQRCTRKFDLSNEVGYEAKFLNILRSKALYYLITGNDAIGREAVELAKNYLSCVEFGNLLDITRENGETIYTGSLIYDWCYDLLTAEDKTLLRKNLLRLARSMECGWPPFGNYITVGHGNEAQINRDLLSMAVAIYDEDPVPLQYCSYQVFERLLPQRKFEYRSPRHSQGLSYSAFRFRWEMYAALIFKRMLGQEIFSDGFKKMGYYWINMQTPQGVFFREGDGISWSKNPISAWIMLLCSSYSQDPVFKDTYFKTGNRNLITPFDFLLFNNTDLAYKGTDLTMPHGFDFGPVYPGISVRTNWEIGSKSEAAAAVVRGGGYHSGNHQHSDAGGFQIAYRGHIISPLTTYRFAGIPYDVNFNKRSVSRSMLLIYDPTEKFGGSLANDGGSRYISAMPFTLDMLTRGVVPEDRKHLGYLRNISKELSAGNYFKYGTKLATVFAPDAQKPVFSIYSADLKGAYSNKVRNLVRTFAFIDLGKADTPAVAVVYDQLSKRSADLAAYWQVTTLVPPEVKGNDLVFSSYRQDKGPRGKMLLQMIKPAADKRKLEILTGEKAHNVFGRQFTPPQKNLPEANGSRVMFRNMEKSANQEFLSVMSLYAAESAPEPVKVLENADCYTILAADRALVLVKGLKPSQKSLRIKLPANEISQLAVYNLQPGVWQLLDNGKAVKKVQVQTGNLALYHEGKVSDLQLNLQK